MQRIRKTALWTSLLCLAFAPIAFAGPGGTYGPSSGYGSGYNNYGKSGYGTKGYGTGGYKGYNGGGFGDGFHHDHDHDHDRPSGYVPNRPNNSAIIQVRPSPNTIITVQPGNKSGGYYNNSPGGNRPGYNPKPIVTIQPNYTRPGNNHPHQNNYSQYHRPHYYNGGWYHGDWHGNWNKSFNRRPYAWGGWNNGNIRVSAVAVGSPWRFGYWSYSNPYYTPTNGPAYFNYSQPILGTNMFASASATGGYGVDQRTQDHALEHFNNARAAFFAGDYRAAQNQVDEALALVPTDTVMHEFRALVMFANRQYGPAAGAIYALLSSGPGWDWTTLIGLYPNVDAYTRQLRSLERFCIQNPQAAEAHFLLAYHYLTAGHTDTAAEEYATVLRINPRDTLSAQLLSSLTGQQAGPVTRPRPNPQFREIDARYLIGNWTASREDGSRFSLSIDNDGHYRWRYGQGGRPQEFVGTYSLANNVLVLNQNDQPMMVGEITPIAGNRFNFKLTGGDEYDPGLDFSR